MFYSSGYISKDEFVFYFISCSPLSLSLPSLQMQKVLNFLFFHTLRFVPALNAETDHFSVMYQSFFVDFTLQGWFLAVFNVHLENFSKNIDVFFFFILHTFHFIQALHAWNGVTLNYCLSLLSFFFHGRMLRHYHHTLRKPRHFRQ
jgi:hypothetical protein